MGSDGLFELDEECWTVLAKYNLLLTTVFAAAALLVRQAEAGQFDAGTWRTLLLVENGGFALLFGAVQTYTWVSR